MAGPAGRTSRSHNALRYGCPGRAGAAALGPCWAMLGHCRPLGSPHCHWPPLAATPTIRNAKGLPTSGTSGPPPNALPGGGPCLVLLAPPAPPSLVPAQPGLLQVRSVSPGGDGRVEAVEAARDAFRSHSTHCTQGALARSSNLDNGPASLGQPSRQYGQTFGLECVSVRVQRPAGVGALLRHCAARGTTRQPRQRAASRPRSRGAAELGPVPGSAGRYELRQGRQPRRRQRFNTKEPLRGVSPPRPPRVEHTCRCAGEPHRHSIPPAPPRPPAAACPKGDEIFIAFLKAAPRAGRGVARQLHCAHGHITVTVEAKIGMRAAPRRG